MSLEKSERYTMIGIDEDSGKAQIISFIRADVNKLGRLCKQYPKSYQHVSDQYDEGEIVGKEFICDKKLVSFRAPSKKKPMSDEQKKEAGERLKKTREKTKKKSNKD